MPESKPIIPDNYALKHVYDAELVPHLDAIRAICEREKIPFLCVAQTKQGSDGSQMLTLFSVLHGIRRASPQMLTLRLIAEDVDRLLTPLAMEVLPKKYNLEVFYKDRARQDDAVLDNLKHSLDESLGGMKRE